MNNNNRSNNSNSNNRRRGRGNRPQGGGGGGGGGQQLNRIDSRARGNAPQLLEKYRKLAHDAHLNGDRVQAEYFLQYADHYFRVIADGRQRVEDQRLRRDERYEGGAEEADEAGEFSVENDFPSYDQASFAPRPQREDRPPREDRPQREDRAQREDRPRRFEREDEAPRAPQETPEERFADTEAADEGEAQANPYEPPENPFVRENRVRGGLRPRRAPRQAQDDREDRPRGEDREESASEPAGLDPSSLPPAISAAREDSAEQAEAKPRRGRPRKKPSADDAGEALESVS